MCFACEEKCPTCIYPNDPDLLDVRRICDNCIDMYDLTLNLHDRIKRASFDNNQELLERLLAELRADFKKNEKAGRVFSV